MISHNKAKLDNNTFMHGMEKDLNSLGNMNKH